MLVFLFGVFLIKIATIVAVDIPSDHKITVALSERKPFTYLDQNGVPKGLDILIIENFAKKFKFQLDFIIVNSSLNYIFTNEEYLRDFLAHNFTR